jgi:pyruvate dehydrogenase E2 component (dihydrolipoamide acetyltransferase)
MMGEFKMPSLGADMDSGTLVEWKFKSGDKVKRGDIIATVETAKGTIDVEVFDSGTVGTLLANAGQEVAVGMVLTHILADGEADPGKAAAAPPKVEAAAPPPPVEVKPVAAAAPAAPAPAAAGPAKVSPLARRIAAELGVDLSLVTGTGPGGAIQRADIERTAKAVKTSDKVVEAAPPPAPVAAPPPPPVAAPAPVAAPPPVAAEKPAPAPEAKKPTDFQTAMRGAIAAAMSRSNRDIPHYYLETKIDMTKAQAWLEAENAKRSMKERLLMAAVTLKAVAKALHEVPELNGFWVDGHQVSEEIHVCFAIALRQGGLITPCIHNTDNLSWDELREAMNDLIMRTRANKLRSSELTDGTITVTSLGERGVEKVFGVIYPPQVALVGLGKVIDSVWVENGMIGVRPVMVATLAGDHRATDGHRGGIFLEALNRNLQEVEKL